MSPFTLPRGGPASQRTAIFINTAEFIRAWQTNAALPNRVSGSFEILCPGPVIVEDNGA